jgi:mono/diheme cytochrome c family protein
MRTLLPLTIAIFLGAPAGARAAEPPPSPAAKLFAKKCGSCHSLGEGDRQGPDLVGVTQRRDPKWLRTMIRTPGTLIDSGDPVVTDLLARFKGVRMPDQTLTDTELEGILEYLAECTARGGCKLAMGDIRHASQARPDEIEAGRLLFEGRRPLGAGGASCISCHNVRGAGIVGGGTLAKDLTHVYARLGDAGTTAAIANAPFPMMKDIYAKKPLTDTEVFQIKAFLAQVAKDGAPVQADHNFFYLGVLGLFLSLGAIGLIWSGRMRGVRAPMVKRGKR